MCIIASSKIGVDLPDYDTIRLMWDKNPDGAGFMWADGKNVRVSKGYMEFENFITAIEKLKEKIDTKNTAVVMHFRIGTSGGNIPANTHPFPVVDKLAMLKTTKSKCDLGVAHNGIIDIDNRKGMSDTMEYILQVLAPLKKEVPNFLKCSIINKMIEQTIDGSRLCFLEPDGNITYIGDWQFDSDTGIYYSNSGYKKWYNFRNYDWKDAWYYGYDDDKDNNDIPTVDLTDVFETKFLSFVYDNHVLVSPYGEMMKSFDYPEELMVDNIGNVYFYDYGNDIAVLLDGYKLYSENMQPYNLDDAEWQSISVVSYADYEKYFM